MLCLTLGSNFIKVRIVKLGTFTYIFTDLASSAFYNILRNDIVIVNTDYIWLWLLLWFTKLFFLLNRLPSQWSFDCIPIPHSYCMTSARM